MVEKETIIFQKQIIPFRNRFFKSIAIESVVFIVFSIFCFYTFNNVDASSFFFYFIIIWCSIPLFSIILSIRMHYKFESVKISLITFSDDIFTFNILRRNDVDIKEIKAENIKTYIRWAKANRRRLPVLSIFDQNKKIAVIYTTNSDNEPEEIEYKIRTHLKYTNK